MTDSVRFTLERPEPASTRRLAALLAALVAASAAAAVAFNGNVALTALPVLGFLLLYTLWKLPLRVPLMVMTFIGLTFENPGDVPAVDLWHSPLYPLGKLLLLEFRHLLSGRGQFHMHELAGRCFAQAREQAFE